MQDDIERIAAQRARWVRAINEGSADGFVAVLTEDAVWLPPGRDAIAGRQRIRDWLEQPFSELEYEYDVSDIQLRVAGDWAVEQSRFSSRVTPKDGEALPVHAGVYTLIWRRVAADWCIERYIDHTADLPLVQ